MRARRRSSGSDLPHAPLLMLHPLAVPGAQVPGREIVRELRTPLGALLYALHWAALSWSYSGTPAPQLAEVESDALARMGEGEPWAAIAVLAGQLAGSEPADPSEMAQACHCIADWALAQEARDTAVAFMILAALVFPRHPRYAWAAGRMLRTHGRMREAEFWFKRSYRIAVWARDAEAQVKALNSLGNLQLAVGRKGLGKHAQLKALTIAKRHLLRALEGEVSHDLFIVYATAGEHEAADTAAASAFEAYAGNHPNLPMLVHDVAQHWLEQGYCWRSLPIFQALIQRADLPHLGLREYASAARASGVAGERTLFENYSSRVEECLGSAPARVSAEALYEVALGAFGLREFTYAVQVLERASKMAIAGGAAETESRCEVALAIVNNRAAARVAKRGDRVLNSRILGDALAHEIAQTIGSATLDAA